MWKDYYLDHKHRLDEFIHRFLNPPKPQPKLPLHTVKKPSPGRFKAEPSPVISSAKATPLPASGSIHVSRLKTKPATATPPASIKRERKSEQPIPLPQQSGSRRATINSMTAPSPVYGDRLPPPNAEVKIPEPPSRSPSPPTTIIPHRGRGNKYTPEDRDFFLKFISWRLKCDSTLTRLDLCAALAEKVTLYLYRDHT